MTIPELIDQSAHENGNLEALVDGDVQWSFNELKNQIYKVAKAIIETGIKVGDRIGIWAPNSWEWVIAALGVHVAGGVLVPITHVSKEKKHPML